MGSSNLPIDLKLILDEGSTTATGILEAAQTFCQLLGVRFNLEPSSWTYDRGWGIDVHIDRDVIATWDLHMQDLGMENVTIEFELTDDDSLQIIGLDLQRYCVVEKLAPSQFIKF